MSKLSFFPPIITEMVPSMAFGSPPLTGASISSMPFLASSAPIAFVSTGSMELMSMTMVPSLAPSAIPFSPRQTSLTCGELGSMVMMTEHSLATSAGEDAGFAPSAASSSTLARLLLYTTSSWPPLITFLLIGFPMIPSPINPTFILITS